MDAPSESSAPTPLLSQRVAAPPLVTTGTERPQEPLDAGDGPEPKRPLLAPRVSDASEPGGSGPAKPRAAWKDEGLSHPAWRWVMVMVYVVLAGVGYSGATVADDGWAVVIISGVVGATFALAFWAGVFYALRRLVRRPRRYPLMLFSVPIVCLCLLGSVGTAANRARERDEASGAAAQATQAGDIGADSDSAEDPDLELIQFDDWFTELSKSAPERNRTVESLERAVDEDTGHAATMRAFIAGIRHAEAYRARMAALPTGGSAELAEATGKLEDSAMGLRRALISMRDGYRYSSEAKWTRGQELADASDRDAQAGLIVARRYFRALGGKDAFGKDYPISKLALEP